MAGRPELFGRAREYASRYGLVLGDELGFGVHGTVFVVQSQPQEAAHAGQSAIKVHEREPDYCRERDAYLRLKEHGIRAIGGCHVPQLLRYDDELWIVEMTVVTRPFVLDFAGAFLDKPPDFPEEVLADWRADKQEQFEKNWPRVESILRLLQNYGIFLVDVSPSNISLTD